MESQTPREILTFSAALRLPSSVSPAQRAKLVAKLIRLLRLERAADTIVGDPSRGGGISGGERKRTNVGGELVTNPSVIFLDEPTSGLDAFTSLKVMGMLKVTARQRPRTQRLNISAIHNQVLCFCSGARAARTHSDMHYPPARFRNLRFV